MKILAFIGILLLVILAIIIFVLLGISITKLRIVFELLKTDDKQEVYVTARFWKNLISIPLLKKVTPNSETTSTDKKEKENKRKKPDTNEEKAGSFTQTIKNITDLYYALKPSAIKGFSRIKKHTSIDPFKLYINYGAKDPAVTGMTYGAIEASIKPALVVLDEVFDVTPVEFRFNPDFDKERFDVYLFGIIRLRFVHIIMGLISIAMAYWRYKSKNKKSRKKS